MRLARLGLKVNTQAELESFYTRTLGMQACKTNGCEAFAFAPKQCAIEFERADFERYQASEDDLYWKIGVTVRNLDAAVDHLRKTGWPVSDPHQFRDIGYMAHTRDPQGFVIELLQTGLEGHEQPIDPTAHPIASQATLAHISLRVNDIVAARTYFENNLKMRLMSVQPVTDLGFTLYFYAWSNEPLPNSDHEAIENRQWLWARPYALIELQHYENRTTAFHTPPPNAAGFSYIAYEDDSHKLINLTATALAANCTSKP